MLYNRVRGDNMGFWSKFGHVISPYYNLIIFAFAVITIMIAVNLHQNRQSVDNEIYGSAFLCLKRGFVYRRI